MSTRSGGPATPEGKAVTRYNAAKHGTYSESPVLPKVESEEEWELHRRGVFEDVAPVGYFEEAITERIALNFWRLKRLVRYEREQIGIRQAHIPFDLATAARIRKIYRQEPESDADVEARAERMFMDRLIPEDKDLNLLMRYEGRLLRHILQLLHELEARQNRRRGRPAPLARLDIHGLPDSD